MRNVKLRNPIYSFTLKELLDNEDPNFLHRSQRVKELESPLLLYCYANSLVFEIKSSKFGQKEKLKDGRIGTNNTKYKVYVLFEDFYMIGKDKEIPFEDAIDYAINYGDIHIRCRCPSMLYHGFSFIGTEMKYLYGLPRENRYPKINNPQLKSTMCKHCDVVIEWIFRNTELITKMFAQYYNRLQDGQSIYAVNTNGSTITIGHKNDEGDVFFEQEIQKENEMDDFDNEPLAEEQNNEESNVTEAENEWHIEDPTEGAVWDDEYAYGEK